MKDSIQTTVTTFMQFPIGSWVKIIDISYPTRPHIGKIIDARDYPVQSRRIRFFKNNNIKAVHDSWFDLVSINFRFETISEDEATEWILSY